MKSSWLSLLLVAFLSGGLWAQSELETRLFELPDLIFKPIEAPDGYEAAYELHIKQPLDHKDPSKGFFWQRAYLSHRAFDRPVVMAIEGYGRPRNRMYELSSLLQANQLDIEHRYFGASMPDSVDYTYLTFEQASADLHHIRELFGSLYAGKWVSTGISKGGTNTLIYRYFYPEDVDASVAYVAPVNHSVEDPRIYEFLRTVGDEDCRRALYEYQLRVLRSREEALPRLDWFARGAKLEFTYHTLEEAFEYAVLEYPFSFWQWGHKCEDIPGPEASLDAHLQHLMDVVGLAFYADGDVEGLASAYYMFAHEMGYYGYETEPFEGYLQALPLQPHPNAAFTPGKMKVEFDPTLSRNLSRWLAEHGNRILYIYGELDTWSACAVPPSDKVDARWFILEGQDHRGARIRNMSAEQKSELMQALESWLGLQIPAAVED